MHEEVVELRPPVRSLTLLAHDSNPTGQACGRGGQGVGVPDHTERNQTVPLVVGASVFGGCRA